MPVCLLAAVMGACSDPHGASPEPDVAEVRLDYGFGSAITLSRHCVVNPSMGLSLTLNQARPISASFFRGDGTKDPIVTLADFRLSGVDEEEPRPTPSTIGWTRIFQIAGLFTATETTGGSVLLSLYHVSKGHTDWGPCALPLSVMSPTPP
jgi:hypothetical protein